MNYQYNDYSLPYTICFCVAGNKVLLIKRNKEPYLNQWNGLGGKIEEDENPEESAKRETAEETGLDLSKSKVTYVGIVTWNIGTISQKIGMYAFLFEFPASILFDKKETREGLLEWKEMDWIVKEDNQTVAENVKYFLPEMLKSKKLQYYHCEYTNPEDKRQVTKFEKQELDPTLPTK